MTAGKMQSSQPELDGCTCYSPIEIIYDRNVSTASEELNCGTLYVTPDACAIDVIAAALDCALSQRASMRDMLADTTARATDAD